MKINFFYTMFILIIGSPFLFFPTKKEFHGKVEYVDQMDTSTDAIRLYQLVDGKIVKEHPLLPTTRNFEREAFFLKDGLAGHHYFSFSSYTLVIMVHEDHFTSTLTPLNRNCVLDNSTNWKINKHILRLEKKTKYDKGKVRGELICTAKQIPKSFDEPSETIIIKGLFDLTLVEPIFVDSEF